MFTKSTKFGSWPFPVFGSEGVGRRDLVFVVEIESGEQGHVDAVHARAHAWSTAVSYLSAAQTGWPSSVVCGNYSWVWVEASKMSRDETITRDVAFLPEMLARTGHGLADEWGRGEFDAVPIGAVYVSTTIEQRPRDDANPKAAPRLMTSDSNVIPLETEPLEAALTAELLFCTSMWSPELVAVVQNMLNEYWWDNDYKTQPGSLTVAGHEGHPGLIRVPLHPALSFLEYNRPDLTGFVTEIHSRLAHLAATTAETPLRFTSMVARPTNH